jgi:monofunctional biosynthetic peptidoglycan transglycosylase
MSQIQFPENELSGIFNKIIPYVKKRKLKSFLLYLFFIVYFSLPALQIPVLEFNQFRVTSFMEERALENNMLFYPVQSWVSIDKVTPNLLKSIIAMEDGSFFRHKGIDWKELKTSLRLNKRRGRAARGGSTITMQLAKNLFLTPDKTILRKAKEFLITVRMEKELTKQAILQNYINAVEWGDGLFGIRAASEEYFGKEPAELTINECSRLAAVIPSPLKYRPNTNSRYVLRRSAIIRGRLGDIILFPQSKL